MKYQVKVTIYEVTCTLPSIGDYVGEIIIRDTPYFEKDRFSLWDNPKRSFFFEIDRSLIPLMEEYKGRVFADFKTPGLIEVETKNGEQIPKESPELSAYTRGFHHILTEILSKHSKVWSEE